jgi:glycosyltransferase involved in cell wall biosynthesis
MDARGTELEVCFVLPSLEPGGAERVAVNLANGLSAVGARVRFLLSGRPGPLAEGLSDDVSLEALHEPRVRHATRALVRLIRSSRPDVLFSTHLHTNLLLCALRPLLPRRLVLVVREPIYTLMSTDPGDRRMRRWERVLYRQADLVIATSEMMRCDLAARVGDHVRLLPNPVDEATIRGSARGVEARVERPQGRLFVAIGRLVHQKAYPDLLAAFADVAGSEDALMIFGEGPQRARLERIIRTLRLDAQVSLRGLDPDLWAYLAVSDALVLASTYEGMPNAALEALALGVPVLATTDLAVLEDVRRTAVDGAVTLVARAALSEALAAVPRSTEWARDSMRPSLLPEAHRLDAVVETLQRLLDEVVAQQS